MKKLKVQSSKLKVITLLTMLFLIAAFGCQKVDKPVRGEEGSSPMAIVIEGDPPASHTENKTSEGRELAVPYSNVPVAGSLFKSGLSGLDYWKANHPNLVTGTHNPKLIVQTEDETEECLMCHDQNTSCNNCHKYVGVKPVTTDQ